MFSNKRNTRKFRRKRTGIVLNVKVSRTRKVRKFFSSAFFKKVVVLISFSAIGVFGTLVGAMGLEAFFKDPRYQINEISVYNQNLFSKQEILQMSGLSTGMYWFDFSVSRAAREIEKNPNVKRAQVERVLPNKVLLKVVERRPVALLRGRRQDFLIDEEGVVLPMRNKVAASLPVINGAKVSQDQVGQKIDKEQMRNALSFLSASLETDLPLGMEIHQINVSHPSTLVARTQNGLKIFLGEGDYEKNISRLLRVTDHLERNGKWAESIDLRFKDVVVRPIVMKTIHTKDKLLRDALPVIRVERR